MQRETNSYNSAGSSSAKVTYQFVNGMQMIYLVIDGIRMISTARKSSCDIKSLKNFFVVSLVAGLVGSISTGVVVAILSSICSFCQEYDYFKLFYSCLGLSSFLAVYSFPCVIYMCMKQKALLAYRNIV